MTKPTRLVPYPPFNGTQLCASFDWQVFFPDNPRDSYDVLLAAKELCPGCPFYNDCRDYAVSHLVSGVWAGMGQGEREKERIRLGIQGISVSIPLPTFVRSMLAEVDDGSRGSADVAAEVGCSAKTVQRWRLERAEQRQAVA